MSVTYEVNAEFAGCQEPTVENTYRLVKSIANSQKMRSRIASMAHVLTVEDIEQELWIAWISSKEKFDPQAGVRFSTYYMKMAYWHINRVFENQAKSVRATSDNITVNEGEHLSLFDKIADEGVTPEEFCENTDAAEKAISELSTVAQQVVAWLKEPPEVLAQELERVSWDITINRVARFAVAVYGLPKQHESRIVKEVKNMAETSL